MNNAKYLSEMLQTAGYSAYVVGGAVRDSLMGMEPKDWDLATDATPEQIMFLFKGKHKVIPTGIQYGTVTVVVESDLTFTDPTEDHPEGLPIPHYEHIEITTFRADQSYSDGRRPDAVTYSKTIEEDLARRDFTCNAIAWDLVSGLFVDPYGGQRDIADGVLQCVGNPEDRFAEDGLRILRAIRFGVTKGLTPTQATLGALLRKAHMVNLVSKERVRSELLKILDSPEPAKGLEWMRHTMVLNYVCPKLVEQVGARQNKYHAFAVWPHTLACLEHAGKAIHNDPVLVLAVLLHDIAKPATSAPHPKRPGENQFLQHETIGAEMAAEWMREYKFSNDEVERVSHLIRHHLVLYEPAWSNAAVRRWVQRVGADNLEDLDLLVECDLMGKGLPVEDKLKEMDSLLRRVHNMPPVATKSSDLAVNGHEVMEAMGVIKGNAHVGTVMKHLLDVVTDDPSHNTREYLLKEVLAVTVKHSEVLSV